MNDTRWLPILRSWAGPLALLAMVVSAGWLLAVWVPAFLAEPAHLALVDDLRERARTEPEAIAALLAETERQTEALVFRHALYPRLGFLLALSTILFVAWLRWFRPARGQAVGVPAILRRYLEQRPPAPLAAPPSRFRPRASAGTPDATVQASLAARPRSPDAAEVDTGVVDEIVQAEGRGPEATIPILQAIQSHYRYLPEAALARVSVTSDITPAQITGVATFYDQFRHRPVGEHIVRVCEGTACHVTGAVEIGEEIRRCLGLSDDADTDETGAFTIERVACVGSCSLAPVVTVDDRIYGHVAPIAADGMLRDVLDANRTAHGNGHGRRRPTVVLPSPQTGEPAVQAEIRIGVGSCGIASGALQVQTAVEEAVGSLGGGASVKLVGCQGLCHREPLVEVVQNGHRSFYGNVTASDAGRIVRRHVEPRGIVRRVREGVATARARLFDDAAWMPITNHRVDTEPFMGKQVRVVLENCGQVDPTSLPEYLARDGMRALERCLTELTPENVIGQVRDSGLRGRGGAGFPTGTKWEIARKAPGSKYLICNGDEGDPGAFMDRAVLEGDPFRVIEGLAIAGYAIGADEGFVYVRREYPIAVRHVRASIEAAEAKGYLGSDILGRGFDFTLRVREGAGAFVCGEETALIASIEGRRGMPRLRPPFPTERGLWGRPTVINNVETLACLPWIVRRGPDAFAALGTETSKGTKVFSLAGKINRGGLIEVPMGITIREIVEDIGGGLREGRSFKAVLLGGPSGGCIPASLADTRIDYEQLASTGSIMGSGGLVVLDDRDCVVDIARYFLSFTQRESCGKCTFCRVGTKRMLEILDRICAGEGRPTDLSTLEDLSGAVSRGSLCGLGQTAPNPVLTTLRYFRDEYEAHIAERRCPAGHCKALVHYRVLESCTGCTLCAQACPVQAIDARPYERHVVDDDRCTRCGMCLTACPEDSIQVA